MNRLGLGAGLAAGVAALGLSGCLDGDGDGTDVRRTVAGIDIVRTAEGSARFEADGRLLYELVAVERQRFEPDVEMAFGSFDFEREGLETERLELRWRADVLELATAAGAAAGRIDLAATPAGHLRLEIEPSGASADALRLVFSCAPEDRFWGFGEQYNHIDLRGESVEAWVQEQGVGRVPEDDPGVPLGSYTQTYFPMPYTLDPAAGRGFLLDETVYSRFELCTRDNPDEWSATVWRDGAAALLFPGPEPADVVEQLTAEVGRPPSAPPDWALEGVWLAAQGGTTAVTERVQTALDAEIPVAAVWAQDWVGQRNFGGDNFGVKYRWNWDPGLYPNLPTAIAELEAKGVYFLGYFNPFVVPDFEQYAEAADADYLIETPDGEVYEFPIITFPGSLIDLSDPAAVDYFKGFAETAVDLGIRGWMADFGEWLPFDAQLANTDAAGYHNRYATEWHRVNREVLEDAYGEDFVMLTRSGYTGEHEVAQIVWAGDQEADWSVGDGLPTVVKAGLSLGLAGIPFFTHDIAGFSGGPSTKELFMRWTELGAFAPVMRTHDGLKKFENHRFDSDPETTRHFRMLARMHGALLSYWNAAAAAAVETGLPIIRHTALVDPGWAPALDAHHQWMLGPDWVFVPVVAPGKTTATAWLPRGEWEHALTGAVYGGRRMHTVDAPVGEPALFVRAGAHAAEVQAIRDIWRAEWGG